MLRVYCKNATLKFCYFCKQLLIEIVGTAPRERITPVLNDLHWLPIKARIMFKICVLTYIALNTGKSAYLRNKLSKITTELGVSIRHSHDPHRLNEPRMNKEIGSWNEKF